jgi:hypothetical protein
LGRGGTSRQIDVYNTDEWCDGRYDAMRRALHFEGCTSYSALASFSLPSGREVLSNSGKAIIGVCNCALTSKAIRCKKAKDASQDKYSSQKRYREVKVN